MRGYPQFSSITLVKICFSRIFSKPRKNTFELVGTALKCKQISTIVLNRNGRRGALMVRVLDARSSGPGSGPGRRYCVVFVGKTLYTHGASLHPGV